ncbi:unnamed protein product [Lactuca virosa]|uniref:Uncharacterized protein n=1 Tax=Lactuca virosa TaxID=75947 RepID=A0AAU9PEL2_9ASTR|nr:unnamed protein product [Lactuca virosa]
MPCRQARPKHRPLPPTSLRRRQLPCCPPTSSPPPPAALQQRCSIPPLLSPSSLPPSLLSVSLSCCMKFVIWVDILLTQSSIAGICKGSKYCESALQEMVKYLGI